MVKAYDELTTSERVRLHMEDGEYDKAMNLVEDLEEMEWQMRDDLARANSRIRTLEQGLIQAKHDLDSIIWYAEKGLASLESLETRVEEVRLEFNGDLSELI